MLRLAAVIAGFLLCSGCVVPSLNALYTPDKAVYDPALLGKWAEAESDVKYEFLPADGESYGLLMTSAEGKEARFICNLVQLGEYVFLDMYPADLDTMFEAYAPWNIMPMHSFYMIQLQGDELVVKTLNPEWLMQLHVAQPGTVDVAQWQFDGGDSMPLLTGSTAQLQEFIANNVGTPDAFYGEMHLARSGT
jgi:hypothetical protein